MTTSSEQNESGNHPHDAKTIEELLAAFGAVKSLTHGRIRLQVRPEFRTPEAMAGIKAALEQDHRVKAVAINPRTGSITVTYQAEHHGPSLLWAAFKEAELIGEAVFDLPEDEGGVAGDGAEGGGGEGGTYGKLDQQFADVMVKVDQTIYRWSNGRVHTRGRVFPLALAGVGVAQMVVYGISLELLPGPLLIWLAHDIHRRFGHEHTAAEAEVEQALQEKRAKARGQLPTEVTPGPAAASGAASIAA